MNKIIFKGKKFLNFFINIKIIFILTLFDILFSKIKKK